MSEAAETGKARFLAELTREQARELAPHAVLILPTAAVEQHGPHLPMVTDSLIAERLAEKVAAEAGTSAEVIVAPTLHIGSSDHHLVYAALSLRSESYYAQMVDVLTSAALMGFRKIFVLNAHGGNANLMQVAARDVTLKHDTSVAAASYWDLARHEIVAHWPTDAPVPGHAGAFETSLMLALAPHLVRLDLVPSDGGDRTALPFIGPIKTKVHRHGEWARIDGYTDVPTGASPELGNRLLEIITSALAAEVVSFSES